MSDLQDRRAILRGILLLVVSASLFGAVDGLSKILADTQSVAQIVWARYVLAIPVILASVRPAKPVKAEAAAGWGRAAAKVNARRRGRAAPKQA